MIDHFTLTVRDADQTKDFYEQALAPLGYRVLMKFEQLFGFGDNRKPYFWIKQGVPHAPMHIAFVAKDRSVVDAFHRAALSAGARDDGQPGIRDMYHPHYYAAFVIDPNGHPIEAVCHSPVKAAPKKKAAKRPAPKKRAARRK